MSRLAKVAAGFFIFCGISASSWAMSAGSGSLSAEQKKQVEQVVHEYLLEHPEVLKEAAIALRKKTQKEQMQQAAATIKAQRNVLFHDPNSPTAGAAKPSVYLVDFFDYQCGHCKHMEEPINAALKREKSLQVIYKEFPIFGKSSEIASQVALAADKQGKYAAVHKALMQSKNPMNETKALAIAKQAGCDMKKLKEEMHSKRVRQQLAVVRSVAAKLRLDATPALIVVGKDFKNPIFVPGGIPSEVLFSLIDRAKR